MKRIDGFDSRNQPRRVSTREQADNNGGCKQPWQGLQQVNGQYLVGHIVEQWNDDFQVRNGNYHGDDRNGQAFNKKLDKQLPPARSHCLTHANLASTPQRLCGRQVCIVDTCHYQHQQAQQLDGRDNW